MMQRQRMANDGREKIYYLDLMGISHRSYFAV